jgi:tRNA U34 2-thiouridine synthase MnmA/TrmU
MPYPLDVLKQDIASNTLIVSPKDALGRNQFRAGPMNWISSEHALSPTNIRVQIRYNAKAVNVTVEPLQNGIVNVTQKEKLPDITPGQTAVFSSSELEPILTPVKG